MSENDSETLNRASEMTGRVGRNERGSKSGDEASLRYEACLRTVATTEQRRGDILLSKKPAGRN